MSDNPAGGQRDINTSGGAYHEGPLNVAGGHVAGDKNVLLSPTGIAALHQLSAMLPDFTGRAAELVELRAAIQAQW